VNITYEKRFTVRTEYRYSYFVELLQSNFPDCTNFLTFPDFGLFPRLFHDPSRISWHFRFSINSRKVITPSKRWPRANAFAKIVGRYCKHFLHLWSRVRATVLYVIIAGINKVIRSASQHAGVPRRRVTGVAYLDFTWNCVHVKTAVLPLCLSPLNAKFSTGEH